MQPRAECFRASKPCYNDDIKRGQTAPPFERRYTHEKGNEHEREDGDECEDEDTRDKKTVGETLDSWRAAG